MDKRSGAHRNLLIRVCALICALTFAIPALAFDVRLSAAGLPDEIAEDLRAASLVFQLKQRDTDAVTAQDIVAAAQADYERIIGVLYDRGYFGSVVSIRVDEREAANIPALSGPAAVQRVDLNVQPGPVFRLSLIHI